MGQQTPAPVLALFPRLLVIPSPESLLPSIVGPTVPFFISHKEDGLMVSLS